jgi:hypothetical protein
MDVICEGEGIHLSSFLDLLGFHIIYYFINLCNSEMLLNKSSHNARNVAYISLNLCSYNI